MVTCTLPKCSHSHHVIPLQRSAHVLTILEVLPFYPSVDFRSSGRKPSNRSTSPSYEQNRRRPGESENLHGRSNGGGLRSNPDWPFPPGPDLPIRIVLVAAPVADGGAAQPAQPVVAPARRQGPVAGRRRRRRPLPRLRARQLPPLPQVHAGEAGMDLGVLKDMPGIRDRARGKLARREQQCRDMLLSSYKEMVLTVSDLVKASRYMRCFSKVSVNSPLVQFTDRQDDLNDSGDGGGTPVFKWLSMLEFENLAQELVEMFVSELHLKRLLLLSIGLKEGAEEHHTSLEWLDELYDGEFYEFQSIGLHSGESCPLPENWGPDVAQARQPDHEVLQVYLTSWLANVNIKMNRIDEVFELVGEEIPIKLS